MSEETNTAVLEAPHESRDDRGAKIRAGKAAAKERRLAGLLKHATRKANLVGKIADQAQERAAFAEAHVEALMTTEQRAVAAGLLPEEDFGSIVQLGIEGRTNGMNCGIFEPPKGFDKQKYSWGWGAVNPGTLDGWRSLEELQQPMQIQGTDIQFPGWKIYYLPDGKLFSFKKGNGELAMVYTLREHWIKINAATAAVSRRLGKAVETKMRDSNLVLPEEVRRQQERDEEQERATLLQLQRMAQMQSTS